MSTFRSLRSVGDLANVFALHSVGESLATFLRNAYPQALREQHAAEFKLVSSGQLSNPEASFEDGLTLLLHRVTVSEHLRNARPSRNPDSVAPLVLDLHYLLSAWSQNAQTEQVLLAWAAAMLHEHAILDASSLTPDAGWAPDEVIHIVPSELSSEDMMRIWDAVAPPYRLSLSYTARVVRIDSTLLAPPPPVVARRLTVGGDI
jgi:hypothetical protein